MQEGVVLALRDIAQEAGLHWGTLGAALKREGRLHLEIYKDELMQVKVSICCMPKN
jgi:hypothetical protein